MLLNIELDEVTLTNAETFEGYLKSRIAKIEAEGYSTIDLCYNREGIELTVEDRVFILPYDNLIRSFLTELNKESVNE